MYRKRNMHYIHIDKVSNLNTVFKNKQTQFICINMNIYKKKQVIIIVLLYRIIAQEVVWMLVFIQYNAFSLVIQ